jgi:hypothetical protein
MITKLIDQFPNLLIMEVHDVALPEIKFDELVYTEADHHTNKMYPGKRYYEDYKNPVGYKVSCLFRDIVFNSIIQPMRYDMRFKPYEQYLGNLIFGTQICRDDPGWQQQMHIDHPVTLLSGVVHITDTITPTHFYANSNDTTPIYTAPSKAGSGAFWLNLPNSWHNVPPVTEQRNHIITFVRTREIC